MSTLTPALRLALIVAVAMPLAACNSSDGAKSSVKLDSVEVEPGTISDDMIILDNSDVDGTALDNSVPVDPAANPESAEKTDAAGNETADEGAEKAETEKATDAKPTEKGDDDAG